VKRYASVWLNVLVDKHVLNRFAHHLVEKEILQIEEKRYVWEIPLENIETATAKAILHGI
jgi:hypothetical protein